jgi:hypothetical protein
VGYLQALRLVRRSTDQEASVDSTGNAPYRSATTSQDERRMAQFAARAKKLTLKLTKLEEKS